MKPILKKIAIGASFLLLSGISAFKYKEADDYFQQLQASQASLTQLNQEYRQLENQYKSLETDFKTYQKDNEAYISFGKQARKIEKEQKDLAQRLNKDQEDLKTAKKKLEEDQASLKKDRESLEKEKGNLQKERDSLDQERQALQQEKNQWQQAQAAPAVEAVASQPQQHGFAQAPANVYYANCSEVRAAGAAPIRIGDPGYSRKLDRDGDGIGCE